jgi:hypothetical protein
MEFQEYSTPHKVKPLVVKCMQVENNPPKVTTSCISRIAQRRGYQQEFYMGWKYYQVFYGGKKCSCKFEFCLLLVVYQVLDI